MIPGPKLHSVCWRIGHGTGAQRIAPDSPASFEPLLLQAGIEVAS